MKYSNIYCNFGTIKEDISLEASQNHVNPEGWLHVYGGLNKFKSIYGIFFTKIKVDIKFSASESLLILL